MPGSPTNPPGASEMDMHARRERREERRRALRRRRRLSVAVLVAVVAAVAAIVVSAGGSSHSGSPAAGTHAGLAKGSATGKGAAPGSGSGTTSSTASVTGPAVGPLGTEAVPILMYHVIAAPPAGAAFPGLYVPPEEFAAQMQALKNAGWHAVTMDQVQAYWHRGVSLGAG